MGILTILLLAACGSADPAADIPDAGLADDGVAADAVADSTADVSVFEIPRWPTPAMVLPAACGVAEAQFCNPLDGAGCQAGTPCDLAADGTWQCLPAGEGEPAAEGATCDGLEGPFCGAGLTCVGTHTASARCARLCCDSCAVGACEVLHAVGSSAGQVGACISEDPGTVTIGNQPARIQGRGHIVTWTDWRDALERQMRWYATTCDDVGGYPLLASATHYGADCDPGDSLEVIAALQDGTGILSYLAWYNYAGQDDPALLATARGFGDYLVDEDITPDEGLWPRVFRSTGHPLTFPQPPDCGIRSDGPYEIEPDKLGIAAVALLALSEATGEPRYAEAALHNAQVLAANLVEGDRVSSPWPFRLDWRDGSMSAIAPEPISGNMSYNLRLFDALIGAGHTDLQAARDSLWAWIRDVQIPNAAGDGTLWAEFFEDWLFQENRTAWAPLAMASYLMERRDALDPDWYAHADLLLRFVEETFVDVNDGFPVCIEQDFDRKPYGGILSTYAAAEARWAALTGDTTRHARAYLATALLIQSVRSDGCPADRALHDGCGGWQEDAQTDRIHNLVTVLQSL